MAKGWEHFSTVNDIKVESDEAKKAREKRMARIMRTTLTLSEDELKKASEERYAVKTAQEDSLVEAYNAKKLKSKRLIKQARFIKKMREEAEKKAAKNTEEKTTVEVAN